MQNKMQNEPVFLLWDCVTEAEGSSLELYIVSSALLPPMLTKSPTVQEGTEMQSSIIQQICMGGEKQNGNPGV